MKYTGTTTLNLDIEFFNNVLSVYDRNADVYITQKSMLEVIDDKPLYVTHENKRIRITKWSIDDIIKFVRKDNKTNLYRSHYDGFETMFVASL